MSAYVIANIDVHDPETYSRYTAATPDSLAEFGGRFLVRGGTVDVREGDWQPKRLVVLEFPDMAAATRWYESDGYQELKAIRQSASTGDLILVEGAG